MKYSIIILTNLAAIVSIGSPGVSYSLDKLTQESQHTPIDSVIHSFYQSEINCAKKNVTDVKYPEECFPYLCHMLLNIVSYVEYENLSSLFVPHVQNLSISMKSQSDSLCPLNYSMRPSSNIPQKCLNFLNKEKYCRILCEYAEENERECIRLWIANNFIEMIRKKPEPREQTFQAPLRFSDMPNDTSPPGRAALKDSKEIEGVKKSESAKGEPKPFQARGDEMESISRKHDIGSHKKSEVNKTTNKDTLSVSEPHKDCKNENKNAENPQTVAQVSQNGLTNNDIQTNNKNIKADEQDSFNKDITDSDTKKTVNGVPQSENNNSPNENIQAALQSIPGSKVENEQIPNYSSTDKTIGEEEDDDINEDVLLKGESEISRSEDSGRSYSSYKNYNSNFFETEDSHFSVYFLMTVSIVIIGYLIYHNKNKILAYALEGRRNKSGRRRPSSASYRKLDSNLEEAIASNPSHASVTNIVY